MSWEWPERVGYQVPAGEVVALFPGSGLPPKREKTHHHLSDSHRLEGRMPTRRYMCPSTTLLSWATGKWPLISRVFVFSGQPSSSIGRTVGAQLMPMAKDTKVDMIWVAGRSPTLVSHSLRGVAMNHKATTLTYLAIAR